MREYLLRIYQRGGRGKRGGKIGGGRGGGGGGGGRGGEGCNILLKLSKQST